MPWRDKTSVKRNLSSLWFLDAWVCTGATITAIRNVAKISFRIWIYCNGDPWHENAPHLAAGDVCWAGGNCLGAEQQHAGGFFFGYGIVGADRATEELVGIDVDLEEGGALGDLAGDHGFAQGILDVALQGAAQGARAIFAIREGLVEDPLLGLLGDADGDGLLCQIGVELLNHQLNNLNEVGIVERLENDSFVEAVKELGVEGLLHLGKHLFFDFLVDIVFAITLEADAILLLH